MDILKSELLQSLRSSGEEALDQLKNLPSEEFEQGRYENGWNARQILAHIASAEWTYPRLIDFAKQPPADASQPDKPLEAKVRGGFDAYNERQVGKRAETSVEELLSEFATNRQNLIQAVEDAGDEILTKEVTSAGGFNGPLARVLHWVAVDHVRMHVNDIVNGSG